MILNLDSYSMWPSKWVTLMIIKCWNANYESDVSHYIHHLHNQESICEYVFGWPWWLICFGFWWLSMWLTFRVTSSSWIGSLSVSLLLKWEVRKMWNEKKENISRKFVTQLWPRPLKRSAKLKKNKYRTLGLIWIKYQ